MINGVSVSGRFNQGGGYKETVEKTYHMLDFESAVAKGDMNILNLSFSTFNGDITLKPLAKNDTMTSKEDCEILIRVKIRTQRPTEDSAPVIVRDNGSIEKKNIDLSAEQPNSNGMGYAASMEIEIAEKLCHYVSLNLKTSNGNLSSNENLHFKTVECKTSNGDVDFDINCPNYVSLTTSNGNLTFYANQTLPTTTLLKTSNGSIRATLPEPQVLTKQEGDVILNFDLKTSNGHVETNMTHKVISKKKKVELVGYCESRENCSFSSPRNTKASMRTSNGNVKLLRSQPR